jgi:hypothetical protein
VVQEAHSLEQLLCDLLHVVGLQRLQHQQSSCCNANSLLVHAGVPGLHLMVVCPNELVKRGTKPLKHQAEMAVEFKPEQGGSS